MGFDERGKTRLSMKVVDQATGQEIKRAEEEQADA
jgi:polyribonucleotide nucleotidyltransferase